MGYLVILLFFPTVCSVLIKGQSQDLGKEIVDHDCLRNLAFGITVYFYPPWSL